MSFPLLRLPDLALEEIIKFCDHQEILFLVQTSQRVRRLISRHTKSHRIKIKVIDQKFSSSVEILCDHQETFRIVRDTYYGDLRWKFQSLMKVRKPLEFIWKREDPMLQGVVDFLMEIFRIEEVSFKIEQSSYCQAVLVLENCVSKNLKIGSVEWLTCSGSDEMARKFLMLSKGATKLNFKKLASLDFKFDHFHLFRMDHLRIDNATWITAEQVVALRNCKRIDLGFVLFHEPFTTKILREYLENPG
uniref:F-box domain-containing protein n=1 Tax=Caenorhabditis tropicalis TaxID=1561998 RepID=A0A1I7UT85_9PELO